jgi:hypothetical protein
MALRGVQWAAAQFGDAGIGVHGYEILLLALELAIAILVRCPSMNARANP